MASTISLKKITDIWKNTNSFSDEFSGSIPLDEAVFNLSLDTNGRAFFFFTDKKGKRLGLEEISSDSSPLGLALSRIKQQREENFSWNSTEESSIYLDQNAEFAYQLFKGERSFLFDGKIVSNAEEKERAKIFLRVEESKNVVGNFLLSLALKTENEILENPLPLTPTYALCGEKIYKTRDLGINYNSLSFFSGNVQNTDKNDLDEYLSLFASIFPSLEIKIEGWNQVQHPKTNAESALNFKGLDEDGNLALNLLWEFEPYPLGFISGSKPSAVIKLNPEKRTIEKIPLVYDDKSGWKKILVMLKSCLDHHKEARQEDENAFALDGDTLFISSALALPFLSENLSELAQNYKLFGTDSLKKYKLKTVSPKTHLKIGSGIDFFDT